jgi:hypothetical protein
MERIQKILRKGKTIVLVDLSNCEPAETLAVLPTAKMVISNFPPKSGLVLTDTTKSRYTKEVASAIKDFASSNTPFIKASAVVGVEGAASILLQTVIFISRREIKVFGSRQEAMDWLAGI